MATRIKLRRDTAANWLEQNPILASGETGFETDTRAMKLGDGATAWADLKYAVTGDLKVTDDTIHGDISVSLSSGLGNRENWILLTQANDGDISNPVYAYIDSVAYDSEGNTFSMGWYDAAPWGTGCYLQKTDGSGTVLFNNYYNEYDSYGYGMNVDKDDNVVMILGESTPGSNDILLVKVNGTDGTIIWQKYLNSFGDYDDYASCIDLNASGDIFISGESNNAGPDGNNAAYVAKFSGANGNLLWSKQYDIQNFNSSGTGLKVDKDGNLAVVGATSGYGDGDFIPVYKIDGANGAILWQGKVTNISVYNGNNYTFGALNSSDITTDSQGNFYFTFTAYMPWGALIAVVTKFNGTNGATVWARQLQWDDYNAGVGSLVCDEQDNVYVSSTLTKYKDNYDSGSSSRRTQHITKINARGGIVWQRFLASEQASTTDGKSSSPFGGQSIAIHGDYILVGGNYEYNYSYSTGNDWVNQPFIAQLSQSGAEFDVNGWKFIDSITHVTSQFITVDRDINNWTYSPADVSDFNFTVSSGDVTAVEGNSDTNDLVYINKSNVNKVTFAEKTLSLPAGGAIDLSREKLGHITAIGSFDGPEGSNTNGDVWLNGNDRDERGATYSAGGWYTYGTWHDWDSYTRIPLVFKTDADGKLIWQAGNALDQNWSNPDLVDVVYHQDTNTVVALGNDGELDGNEGFNILYLDADTGSMKANITHIRPAAGSNDIYPTTLSIMSDGTPVVSGYITSAAATYANVTADGAGLTGSTSSGTLVIPKSIFQGNTTEYPKEDGTWYLYPDQATIYSVNRFGHDDGEAYPAITYTGTQGSGATFDVSVAGGAWTGIAINNGGSGYKPGQAVKIAGTLLGGASPLNDLNLFVDTVDGSGAITNITGDTIAGAVPADGGPYTAVATTATAGTGLLGWVQYAPEGTEYTLFNIDNGGAGYGVGDTVKILGNVLGGATPENDLTITVTAINGTGSGYGGVTGVSLAGTPQSANIKLYGGSYNYTTSSSDINIRHELANDGFIWTPTWSKVFGTVSEFDSYSYDDFHGLTLDSSDNVIVSGYSERTGLQNAYYGYNQTGVVMKFDSTGTLQWAKSLDGSEGESTVWGVATDADDNIYSVMVSTNTNSDPFITKLTPDGDFVWQQNINIWNSDAWAIDVADNGDVMIAGECWNGWFANDYHQGNNNLLVVKFDRDGNKLFSRAIWSQNGIRMNDNDNYSNQLTIRGDRFSVAAYSNDPGGENYQGIVIDLPLDGTGVGDYGDFHYEEVEIGVGYRFADNNQWYDTTLVTDFTSNVAIRPYTFVEAPYEGEDAWRNVTIYADRSAETQTIYKPEGGEVKGVAKITFEDGSVQTTSMQGLPQVKMSQVNGDRNNYWLRPEDNGKHIVQMWGNTVIIPNPGRVDLPVGFAFTIINANIQGTGYGDSSGVWCEGNDEDIYLSGGNGSNDYSWEIPRWSMATLIKIAPGQWMIAGTGLTSGWW